MAIRVDRDSAASLLPGEYSKPGQLRQEYAVDRVLRLANVPGAVIEAQVRPQVPQIVDPPKFGYDRTPLQITDVLATDRWAPMFRSWTSGVPRGNRRDDEVDGHSGSMRDYNSATGSATVGRT
jgi:hypothetical protein